MNASPPLIRTFRARDARSALTAVKAAFGPDAVIIETKQREGGLFRRPHIEVTAASEGGAAKPKEPDHAVEMDVAALRRVMEDVRRSLNRRETPEPRTRGSERELGTEARKAFRHLLERGIDEVQARDLLEEALGTGALRTSEILRAVGSGLDKLLRAAPAPWGADARRTIALVGPTGVGKTTAIAKIAARALLETRFKVGLITVDTYRVGAADQLARYGKIMGVPTYVARDQAALADAIDRTKDADLVLIDTAGRSDAASIEAQMKLVRSAPNVQVQLVMSLATGARELSGVARRYRSLGAERFIFTKLDEAEGPGGALSALAVLSRPVSCLCDGQRVPEDIHAVTEAELVERLIGIDPLGRPTDFNKERLRGSSQ